MIHYTQYNDITKVLIDNGYKRKEEDTLVDLIKNNDQLEISFLSTPSIGSRVIKELIKHPNITLHTDDKTLWRYLRNLHVDIKYNNTYHKDAHRHYPIKAIAIGGSAGALGNIIKIVKDLPYSDIAVFIVIHILPDEKNYLSKILQQCTNYKVKEADHGEKIESNHIYVASPDMHMAIQDGYIYQSKTPKVNFCRPSIEVLFKTLAVEYKENLLSVLTCGYLDDGTQALKDIMDLKGTVLIQNPNECEANDIPIHAITTKNYTHVLDIKHIVEYIRSILHAVLSVEDDIENLVDEIYQVYGYDFRDYDKHSMIRRVELLKLELGIKDFSDFKISILNDMDTFKLLFKKFSINVSDFFRDPDVFKNIRKNIVPTLGTYPHIRVWCSACASGQEPYSVAILLDEMGLLDRSIIYATDFNSEIIEQAKNGMFPRNLLEEFKQNYLKSGGKERFEKWFNINEHYIELVDRIKNKVQFFQHNLATDADINEFHIVFCRNVLIYFDEKLQHRVFQMIHRSLVRKGFLVLGESEAVHRQEGFERFDLCSANKIFRKKEE